MFYFKNDYKELVSLDGVKFKLPKNTYYHLKEASHRQKNNFDNVIVITGGVGSGKSNGAKGICGAYEEVFNKRKYELEDVYFLIENVLQSMNRTDNFGKAINYDEAVQGATGKDGISKVGFLLRKNMITKRKKGHLLTLCIDNPKELSDKIIERCVAWYHCFYIRTKHGTYIKGLFKVFSAQQLQMVYDDLKNTKYRFVEQHPVYKNNHVVSRFSNYSKIFYDEKSYDLKKDKETNLIEEKLDDKQRQRDDIIYHLITNKIMTPIDIAKVTQLAVTTIRDIKNRRQRSKESI